MGQNLNFSFHIRMLHIFGVWPYKNNGIIYRIYSLSLVLGALFMFVSLAYFTYFDDNLQSKLLGIIVCTSVFDVTWKSCYILWKKEKIEETLNDLEETSQRYAKHCEEEKERVFHRIYYLLKILTIGQILLSNTSGILWASKDVIKEANPTIIQRQNIEIPGFTRAFGLEMWFPFAINTYFRFFLGYVSQILLVVWICTNFGLIDLFLITINENLRGHFNIVSYALEGLQDTKDPELRGKLADSIRHHNHLFCLASSIESLLGPIAFTQYSAFTMLFCFLGYSLMNENDLGAEIMKFFVYISLLLTEVFMTSKSCDGVYQKSIELAISAYSSCWPDDMDLMFRIGIQMIIMRAQLRPVIHKAFFFIKINLETLTSVVNSSFSYIAILQNISE